MEPKKNESLFTKLKRKCLADSSSSIAPTPAVGGVEKPAIFLQEEGEEGPGRRIERSNTWRLETGTSNGVSIFKYRLSKGPESILAKKIFIPPSKLRMLVSRDVVERVLEKVYKSYKGERRLRMTDYVKRVWDPPPPNGKSWLKVFTLLYLIQEHDSTILQWIDHDIGDQDLPIRSSELEESEIGRRLKRLLDSLERNRQWGQREMANLDEYQEQLFVPFLTRQPSEIPHKDFVDETILPFVEPDDAKKPKPNNLEGGYGEVIGVEVPSCCYDFKKLFEAQGIVHENDQFALKILKQKPSVDVAALHKKETEMLYLFGEQHEQIITLLMAFTYRDQRCFLFPRADQDLQDFIAEGRQDKSYEAVLWIAEESLQLVKALHEVHFLNRKKAADKPDARPAGQPRPNRLPETLAPGWDHPESSSSTAAADMERKYGRHGDIKPENILMFKDARKKKKGGFGKLVLSDLGLSSVHREVSKSMVPNRGLGATRRYRPPEIDIKDAKITRSLDIWSLGCVFLELINWWFYGPDGYDALGDELFRYGTDESAGVPDYKTDSYFEMRFYENKHTHVVMVKESVSEWFAKLKKHKDCTLYMLDFLNLIEKHMIVVEGLGEDKNLRKRMRTDDLMKELETLQKKCGKRGYAMDPSPEASPITRRDTPTLAVLTATAVERIHLTNEKEVLKTYKGKTRSYHQETLGDEDMKLNNVHVAKKS